MPIPVPSPRPARAAGTVPGMVNFAVAVLALWSLAIAVSAAPAPWYYWRSKIDGARICAQTSPGNGWERDSAPYEGPGCQPRRKVFIVPLR